MELGALTQTFQHAIIFAFQLDKVGYIWIDSLCIIQDDHEDWARESVLMHQVYRNSFLNISATAAENGDDGLYSTRIPQHLWEEEVSLNTTNIRTHLAGPPGAKSTQQSRASHPTQTTPITRCILLDISSWDSLVNRAPINKRGWVLQERLCPRSSGHPFLPWPDRMETYAPDSRRWPEGRTEGLPNYRLVGGKLSQSDPTSTSRLYCGHRNNDSTGMFFDNTIRYIQPRNIV